MQIRYTIRVVKFSDTVLNHHAWFGVNAKARAPCRLCNISGSASCRVIGKGLCPQPWITARTLLCESVREIATIQATPVGLYCQPLGPFLQGTILCFCRALESGSEITELRSRVEAFAGSFAMPGFDVTAIDHSIASANGAANGSHAVAV